MGNKEESKLIVFTIFWELPKYRKLDSNILT